ncbi:MAG: glycosyltransferase family 4 protein [Clostridia bacterium]|nr:glycosyltransferase family 4 protein [Clostridia bacterium]
MKKKILVVGVYPAPYRTNLFLKLAEVYDVTVVFEHAGGDERNTEWFTSGKYIILDTEEGQKAFASLNLKEFFAVILYEYSVPAARKLIVQCKLKRIPYVINCDGVMLTPHGNPVKDLYKRFLISGASAYLASGEHAKEYFLRFGAKEERIHIHPFSALVPEDFVDAPLSDEGKRTLRKKLGLPVDGKLAIGVGRFIPLKRYAELIAAWAEMPADCNLLLVGGGREEEHYRAIIEEKNLSNVILEPFRTPVELRDYYRAADLFVHPTSYDVWGLVLNEAMASGLPVVASDHCIASLELIRDGENGYRTPMGNEKILCERARELLENPQKRAAMAKEALATIQFYTLENMAKCQLAALEKL